MNKNKEVVDLGEGGKGMGKMRRIEGRKIVVRMNV